MSNPAKGEWAFITAGTSALMLSLLTVAATARGLGSTTDDTDDWWRSEAPNIQKIGQITASQHTAILFTIGDRLVGYSTAGTTHRLDLPPGNSRCLYPHPALSHNGQLVAFLDGETSVHCKISLFEIATGKSTPLIDLTYDPGELSWSWDDSEIAFCHVVFAGSIQAIAVRDGSVRTMVPSSQLTIDGTPFGHLLGFSGAVQWTHDGNKLLAGFALDVPTRQPDTYNVEYRIELANDGILSKFDSGSDASVSPVADRIAWYSYNKIILANVDGTDRRVLTGAPRWMGIVPEGFGGRRLTWSPDGKQLFFGVVMSENCSDDVYLLQVETGRHRRFLHHTCITIRDWR